MTKARRSASAKKAAVTRQARTKARVYEVARAYIAGPNRSSWKCRICGKQIQDVESMLRGVGSDCWQDVLAMIKQLTESGVAL